MSIPSEIASPTRDSQIDSGKPGITKVVRYMVTVRLEIVHLRILPMTGVTGLAVLGPSRLIGHGYESRMGGMYGFREGPCPQPLVSGRLRFRGL